MANRFQLLEQEYDDRYAAGEFNLPDDEGLRPGERRARFTEFAGEQRAVLTSIREDEDPLWSDYGKMIVSGGIQIGAGVGWLANNFEWGQSLQEGASELSREFMEDLSPQAKRAMQTEFTSRDEGQLWSNNKWSKAKLIAAQSLLGTAAGMGVGSILTRGLAVAGMTKAVQTAAGVTVQVPTRTAGAIGYGLGESAVAAPGSAAGVEEEIMAMSHDELLADAADYRAVYLALENADPAERARRAKEILAKAAAGDTFYRNMVSTFILSAPLGAIVGGYARAYPAMAGTTRPKSIGIGALGEATQEFLQSGAEKAGENVAMQRAGFDRPTWEGTLEEAVGGAMAGGMMGAGAGIITPLDAEGQVLPDAESPLAALANVEQDELDAALDAELAEQARIEREEEDEALRQMLAEQDEAMRGVEMAGMEAERTEALERQRPRLEISAYKSAEQIRQEEEEYLAEHPEIKEEDLRGPRKGPVGFVAPGRYTKDGDFLVEQRETRLETEAERDLREQKSGFERLEIERENQRLLDIGETTDEIQRGRIGGAPTVTQITPRVGLEEEQLRRTGLQPAEGEIVAGLPVETAGRAGVSVGDALRAAQERAAAAPPPPPPTVTSRRKSKMGEPVVREELVEPEKPEIPPTTKAFNPRRDNIIIAAAKTRGLDKDAWAAEGVDPAEFRAAENAYGSRRAFRAGGMTPDEATEWAAELGFVEVDEHGKAEAHAALDAIMATLGGNPVYTLEGAQFGAEQDRYQAALDELAQETERREDIAGEWDLEVDGVEAHITENAIGDVTVQIGDDETITTRMTPDESNRDLVRAILQSQAAGEGEIREVPVEGAPQTEEEQIAFERAEGKRIVDEMIDGESGMIEATEERVNDLEDAFFADGWKFDAAEQTYRKGNRVAKLTEIEEGRWEVVWETEGAPEMELEEGDMFEVPPELDDVADDLGDQISRLTPESSSTDRNIAVADLGRLKRARHPRADDLAHRLKNALGEQEEVQPLNLSWMPATMRARINDDSAESLSRMDKTSLQAYAIRIGVSDQGTKIEIAGRIKDAVATLAVAEIDIEAAQEVADMVERKAKYVTKKKLTKIQKEALVTAVALSQITSDGEVLVDDLSARNIGGQAIDGLVQKGTIELIGDELGYYQEGAKFKVKYMPEREAPAAPVERLQEARNMLDRRQGEIDEDQRAVDRGEEERRLGERRLRGETEDQFEARLERQAIEVEEFDRGDEELGEIPGFEDLQEETATSPESDMPMPSEDQKEAGNYKKAHITIKGILISIENAVGSIRNGFRMKDHYGYIKRTEGVDGDQVDVFVNPNIQIDYNNNVYIIDQSDQQGNFDEHKVMLGYASELDAVKAYKRNYEEGWTVGPVTEMSMANFKLWLADDAATKRPAAGRATTRKQEQAVRRVRRGLRYSKKAKDKARFQDAKESVNAPSMTWVATALSMHPEQAAGILAEQSAMSQLVTQLLDLEESLAELRQTQKEVRGFDRPQVEQATKTLRDAVTVNVYVLDDYTESPPDIIAAMEKEKMTDVSGVSDPRNGDIYVFADQITDAEHARRVVIHEITHSGLRAAFGVELDPMLLDLANGIPPALQDLADEITETYEYDLSKDEDKIELAEELIAHGSEHFPNLPIIKKFIAKIRAMLRKMGFVEQWTENDVIGLMKEGQGAIKRRGRSLEGISLEEDVEVEETGEIFTIEQDAQELLTQNEKRRKVCEKLRSCL